jgi:nucleoside-diphosphate-sugar epimerase
MVRLLERADLPPFALLHMEGHWDHDGRQMVQAIARVLGDPAVPIRPLQWWLLRVAALMATTPREMMEMRYLWRQPVRLVNDRLVATLGGEPRTPLLEAVRETLTDLQCI